MHRFDLAAKIVEGNPSDIDIMGVEEEEEKEEESMNLIVQI